MVRPSGPRVRVGSDDRLVAEASRVAPALAWPLAGSLARPPQRYPARPAPPPWQRPR